MVGGHLTKMPDVIAYASMNTRETVCIALTMTALHDLEVKTADILNANVMVCNREKTVIGPVFGDYDSKSDIIVRILYGLKSAGAFF